MSKEVFSQFNVVKIKETESDKIYTFIGASTLPDRVREKLPDGRIINGEILSKKVLDDMATMINDTSRHGGKYGSYRTVSLFHDRVLNQDMTLEEAGYVMPTASVKELEDYPGNYGLFVDVKVNKMYTPPSHAPDYTPDKITYKIENNVLGLSVEYQNPPELERIVETKSGLYRYVMGTDDFRGFGFARADLIGNPTAVRVKEVYPSISNSLSLNEKNNKGETNMEDIKVKEMEKELADSKLKLKEMQEKLVQAEKLGEDIKMKEIKADMEKMDAKVKELKLANDEMASKIKESLDVAFGSFVSQFPKPSMSDAPNKSAKVKEAYSHVNNFDFVKFKEIANEQIEANGAKLKELMARDGPGFDFEKYQTLQVKCKGNQMIVVPSAKTKDVVDSDSMSEGTLYQTNAMFADSYVAGITETFLKEDSLMKVMPKIQHIGGNDKFQWKLWVDYTTVTGTSTLAVDPDNTAVARTKRSFEKFETPICEYRDGVEVTDFTQAHSMAAVGDLMALEIQRAAEAVTESMNSDLFKGSSNGVSSWLGLTGLLYIADSSTYTSYGGKTRSAANRLLDATLANTYVTTSEGISVEVVRNGYEKVLAQGSRLGDIAIVMHPTQVRRLFNSEDAAIRNNILQMAGAPPTFGFNRAVIPYIDGIPIIRDYRCESSAGAADMFAVVDLSVDKGFCLVVSKPLGVRGLAKVGTSESAYVSFWGNTVYKAPRNVFVHTSLITS